LQRLVFLEDVAKQFSLPGKLLAAARARLGLVGPLAEARAPEVAAVLFTSARERAQGSSPDQANLLANIRDALAVIPLRPDEALLGILPPFHSFGLTVDMLLPLLCGLRTVYHVNPNDGATLASLVEAYRATLVVGTPPSWLASCALPSQDSLPACVWQLPAPRNARPMCTMPWRARVPR